MRQTRTFIYISEQACEAAQDSCSSAVLSSDLKRASLAASRSWLASSCAGPRAGELLVPLPTAEAGCCAWWLAACADCARTSGKCRACCAWRVPGTTRQRSDSLKEWREVPSVGAA